MTCPLRRDLDQSLVDQHRDRVEVGGVCFEAEPLGLKRDRPAAGEGVEDRRRIAAGGLDGSPRALPSSSSSSWMFSQTTSREMMPCRRSRSAFCSSSVGNLSGCADGSSTSWANSTARQAASGRRAHHRCSVDGWPWRMDFSRADSRLMSSRGSATSMSFGLYQRSLVGHIGSPPRSHSFTQLPMMPVAAKSPKSTSRNGSTI